MNYFTVNARELASLMKLATPFLPSRSVLPIIENFKVEIKDLSLFLTATNLEHGVTLFCQAESSSSFSFVCPPLLGATLEKLSDQPVTIEVGDQLTVKAKEGEYVMALEDPGDYPDTPVVTDEPVSVNSDTLLMILNRVGFCASKDPDKPALSAVLLSGDACVATDAHRLAWIDREGLPSAKIPINTFRALSGLLKASQGVGVSANDQHGQMDFKNGSAWFRLPDHKYPSWRGIIPKYDGQIEVDRELFLSSITRAILYVSSSKSHTLLAVLELDGDELRISAEDADYGISSKEVIPVENPSKLKFKKGVNIKNLESIVSSCNKVMIETNSAGNTAFLIKDEDVNYLLMPMLI